MWGRNLSFEIFALGEGVFRRDVEEGAAHSAT